MGGKFNLNSTPVKVQQQPADVMGWPLDSREPVGGLVQARLASICAMNFRCHKSAGF